MVRQGFCLFCIALSLCVLVRHARADMPPEVKKEFERLIGSGKPEERARAVSLLSQANDDAKTFKFLASFLENERDDKVIDAAAEVMKGFKDPAVMTSLCKYSGKSQFADVRVAYVKVLWSFDDDKAFETVLKRAKDPAWQVRMTVADFLGKAKSEKGIEKTKLAIDLLIKWVVKEPDGRTQNHIRAALYYLTGKDYGIDKKKWDEWWAHERELFGKPKKAEETGPVDKDGDGKPDMTTEVPREKWRDPVAEEDGSRPRPKFFGHELKNARVAFVIDSSGSMGEAAGAGKTKLEIVKEELTKTIESFDKRYWFNMFYYSDFCGAWKKKLQRATEDIKKAAIQWVRGLGPLRMTNIGYALFKAAEDADTDTIILLSDGLPTAGITDVEALLRYVRSWNKYKKIKISTVGMAGCDPNFLQRLAQQNGGSYSTAP